LKLLFADAHCHVNPIYGYGAGRIADLFKKKNGWFLALISLPPHYYGLNSFGIEAYEKAFNILIREADEARRAGLKISVLAGFHPAEIDEYVRRGYGLREVYELGVKVLDYVSKLYEKGLVDGIGEVGRQHYSTNPSRLVLSELIMFEALKYARDYGMLVHLHTEQSGFTTAESIAKITDMIGVNKDLVNVHHVDYETSIECERRSLWYSFPIKFKEVSRVLVESRERLLIESDFIDDPRRPGVSAYPWSIAEVIEKLVIDGFVNEESIMRIMVDHIVKFYGVEPP